MKDIVQCLIEAHWDLNETPMRHWTISFISYFRFFSEYAEQNAPKFQDRLQVEETSRRLGRILTLNFFFFLLVCEGLACEGIYRRHLNKSQIEILFETANDNFDSKINNLNADPFIAAAIVKKFLRELKTPLISDELLTSFDKCESISNKELELKIETVQELVKQMPNSNRDLFSYLMVHLNKLIRNVIWKKKIFFFKLLDGMWSICLYFAVLYKSDVNKMDIASMVLVFQPIIKIKERILKFTIRNAGLIFKSSTFKKYFKKENSVHAMRVYVYILKPYRIASKGTGTRSLMNQHREFQYYQKALCKFSCILIHI